MLILGSSVQSCISEVICYCPKMSSIAKKEGAYDAPRNLFRGISKVPFYQSRVMPESHVPFVSRGRAETEKGNEE
jgi:hypothetical protein